MNNTEIEQYLKQAERKAIKAMSQSKWDRFGYWASHVTHLRRILGLSHTPSPFAPFPRLARVMLKKKRGAP